MPVVRIEMSAGRSREQKKKVALAVTQALVAHCGCSQDSVHVIFTDVLNSDWAVAGRLLDQPIES